MTGPLITPIIEHKTFLSDSATLRKMGDSSRMKEEEYFSADSWDTVSNEELMVSSDQSYYNALTPDHVDMQANSSDAEEPTSSRADFYHALTYDSEAVKSLMEDTEGSKLLKRERNRLAARRCRQKQRDRTSILEKDVKEMESANGLVEREIQLLQAQVKKLTEILANHNCVIKFPQLTHSKYLILNKDKS